MLRSCAWRNISLRVISAVDQCWPNFDQIFYFCQYKPSDVRSLMRWYIGTEEGYMPSDDKFRKMFVMQLKRHSNVTPASIQFLLYNCGLSTLDLADLHAKQHSKRKTSQS